VHGFDHMARREYAFQIRTGIVRQFVYGLILGIAAMYAYARLDPPKILAYLNAATESAVKSTSGYGGRESRRY
jgi:hypothetical protein